MGYGLRGLDTYGLALPGVSANGQYITYIDDALNLVPGEVNNSLGGLGSTFGIGSGLYFTNAYLYDANPADPAFGTNTLVSHAYNSATTSADSFVTTTSISADGSTIAFTDSATNLVAGETTVGVGLVPLTLPGTTIVVGDVVAGIGDNLYVWSRINDSATGLAAGQTVLASHQGTNNLDGATFPSFFSVTIPYLENSPASLSANGAEIAYYFAGQGVIAGQSGTAGVENVFLYNTAANTNTLVTHVPGSTVTAGDNPQNAVSPTPINGPAEATGPQITPDGDYIAYANNSSDLLTGFSNPNSADNVYLYDNNPADTTYGTNILVSHAAGSATTMDAGGGTAPSIAETGGNVYVSFMDLAVPSNQGNLVDATVTASLGGATIVGPAVIIGAQVNVTINPVGEGSIPTGDVDTRLFSLQAPATANLQRSASLTTPARSCPCRDPPTRQRTWRFTPICTSRPSSAPTAAP